MKRILLCLFASMPVLGFSQVLSENFNGEVFPPEGWTITQVNENATWDITDATNFDGNVAFVTYDDTLGDQDETLTSPSLDLTGMLEVHLKFTVGLSYYWSTSPNNNYDVTARVSVDGGLTWTDVWNEDDLLISNPDFATNAPFTTPYDIDIDISTLASNVANVKVAFNYSGADGADFILDDVLVNDGSVVLPTEYCTVSGVTNTEPITLVSFAGIENTTSASIDEESYEDFTTIVGAVSPGQSYPVAVEGNTDGDFDNFITVYIDWNQNFLLDEEGEVYEIGMITDTTGEDGVQATGTIAVPADALTGPTRMRVVKKYDAFSSSPCAPGSSFGQQEDYTLNVSTLATTSFDNAAFAYYPNPVRNVLNLSYKQNITDVKIYNILGQEVLVKSVNAAQGQVDMTNLPSGNYIAKVTSNGIVKTIKVIKE